ncbi:MAG TPA: hypothetical protein VHY77_02765 [Acidimicrobiales bacterium]|nr:hypothetical protein [Acidimicrobiales bacterium]
MGVPAIPGLSCPSGAASLGASSLGSVCQSVAGSIAGPAASLPSQAAGFGADSVLNAAANWVSNGATWLLGQIGGALQSSTQIDLGASWFTAHFETMAALAGVVIVPLLLLGVIQAIHRQSASQLLRSILINVPVALLLTGAAVKLVQLGLALVDAMSADVAHGAGLDTAHFLSATTTALSNSAGGPATPAFVLFLGGLAVVFGSFLLWVELLVRAAAVYVAVLFLPLALASLVWPAVSHWCRRLVDTLAGLVLSKFVIVTVLSLAVSALAGGTNGRGSGGGFSAVLGGAALLFLAAAAPWALFRMLPFAEAAAISHLEGVGRRSVQSVSGPTKGLATTALRSAGTGGSGLALAAGQAGGESGQASGMATAGGVAAGVGGKSAGGTVKQSVSASPGVGEQSAPGSSVTRRGRNDPGSDAFEGTMRLVDAGVAVSPLKSPSSTGTSTSGSSGSSGTSGRISAQTGLPTSSGSTRLHVLGHDDLGSLLQWDGDGPGSPGGAGGRGRGRGRAGDGDRGA